MKTSWTMIGVVLIIWSALFWLQFEIKTQDNDINFLYDHLIIERNHRSDMDSLVIDCLEIIDSRLDKLDSLIKHTEK